MLYWMMTWGTIGLFIVNSLNMIIRVIVAMNQLFNASDMILVFKQINWSKRIYATFFIVLAFNIKISYSFSDL